MGDNKAIIEGLKLAAFGLVRIFARAEIISKVNSINHYLSIIASFFTCM